MDRLPFPDKQEEKIDIFRGTRLKEFHAMIKSEHIRTLVLRAFIETPEYFWTIEASTGGKHHSPGKLVDHVIACCHILVENVFKQMDQAWDQRTKDIALAAMMLHDNWRCGYPGEENKSEEKFHTHKEHAEIGGDILRKLFDTDKDGEMIAEAVAMHYGPWGSYKNEFLKLGVTDFRAQVHIIDAHQAWNSHYIYTHPPTSS